VGSGRWIGALWKVLARTAGGLFVVVFSVALVLLWAFMIVSALGWAVFAAVVLVGLVLVASTS